MSTLSLGRNRIERRPIDPRGPVTLALQIPPSLNNCFVNSPHGGRFPSGRYKEWMAAAQSALEAQNPPRFTAVVEVLIRIAHPVRQCDIDNRIKPILDALTKAKIIPGDDHRFLRKVSAEWAAVEGAQVTIREWAEAAA